MSNTFTVTHPDGSVDRRTSKTMTYTHAIVRVTPYRQLRANLALRKKGAEDAAARYAAEGKTEYADRQRSYVDRYAAELAAMPVEGAEHGVLSWSQSASSAAKRVRAERGEHVVPVDSTEAPKPKRVRKVAAKVAPVLDRAGQASALRASGLTLEAIARQLGYPSRQAARGAIVRHDAKAAAA